MKNIIKSIGGKESVDLKELIDETISQNKVLFSDFELGIFEKVITTYNEIGIFPTIENLESDFPTIKQMMSNAEEYEFNSLKVYIKSYLNNKKKIVVSQKFMELSSEVSDTGFTDDIYDRVSELYMVGKDYDENIEEGIGDIESIYNSKKGTSLGIKTGIKEIDDVIGGMHKGSVNTIFAGPAMGKSMLGKSISYLNTQGGTYNGVMISLEVPKENIKYDMIARHSFDTKFTKFPFINSDKILKGQLSQEEEEFLFKTVLPDFNKPTNDKGETKGKLVILDETDFTDFSFGEIRNKLEAIDTKLGGLDFVVWDQASLFKFYTKGFGKGKSDMDIINAYISFIRRLSIKFLKKDDKWTQLCNVVVTQANREGIKKATKTKGIWSLTAIADANELERASWRAIGIYSDPQMKDSNEMSVHLLKNRSGKLPPELVYTFFQPECNVIGEQVEGFGDVLSVDDFTSKSNFNSAGDFGSDLEFDFNSF